MQPKTMTENIANATIGATAPEDQSIEQRFAMLTDEEKEKVTLFVEQLKANRYNH